MKNLKKSIKKISAVSLAALMLGGSTVAVLPAVAESGIVASAKDTADKGTTKDGLVWETSYNDDKTIIITGYKGKSGNVVIPSQINGKSVTSIGNAAFSDCTGLKSVTIEKGVTSISTDAFYGCTGLKSVNIPDSVTSMDSGVFYGCTGLTSVKIPDSVKSIGGSAFYHCTGLKSVTIPGSVKSIGGSAFYHCTGLKSVTIPGSVKSISNSSFNGCTGLTSVNIPDSVTSIGDRAFTGCTGLKSVTIPGSVTSIGDSAFRGCPGLISVTIPDSVTSIGSFAFGYYWDEKTYDDLHTDLTIFGKTGSEAETYAKENNIPFVSMVEVTGVKLNKTSLSLEKGKSEKLTATITPSNATNKSVTWTSSNTKVATVSNGTVKAVSAGTATITAKTNNGKTATCKVTVKNPVVAVMGVKLNKTSLNLEKGKTTTITATVNPSNATNKTLTWTSSNSKVATVSNGKITAKGVGTATITVKTANGKKAACKVTVKNATVAAKSVKLSKTSITLIKGKSTTIKATVSPTNTTNKKLTWTTSNKKVATVSNGKITAKGVGTATITVKTANGKKAACKVTVKNATVAAKSVKLSKTSVTLIKGKSTTIKATVSPSNTTNKKVTWTTSNKKVATVSNGKITAKGVGTATITVKTANGKKAACKVTVKNATVAAKSVKLSKTSITLGQGTSITIKATINPSNTTNKKLTWTTSNKKVATVSNGKITAKGLGKATITVKTANGKKAACSVTVKKKPAWIKINPIKANMTNGQTYQLKPELPKNTAADITYSSNHASIASVSKYGGKVTAHNPGKAIITIKTHNGKTAKFTVNVTAKCRTSIKQSYVKNNSCYIVNKKITVKGLMLHSVGENIQSAQKWVNKYNSKAYYPLYKGGTVECCVHGFIDGYNGTLYQTLPWNTKGWHSGGSANNSYIGIEMCEPDCIKYTKGANFTCSAKDKAKAQEAVKKTYESAVNVFAYLCAKYKLNPLEKNVIISHNEGYKLGIASGHKDPEHLWKQLGMPYTMDTFRKDVKKAMENQGWIIYD